MEVSSVSPPPAEPTEGDDLCEINVTNVAIQCVTLLIGLCGLVGNGAVLRLLRLKIYNEHIFDLAAVDFFFLLFVLPSTLVFLLEDVSCSPILPQVYVSFLFQLSMMSYYWGLFRLTDDILDMDFLCRLCCRCNAPLRLLWVIDSIQYWTFFSLFTVIPTVTLLCPSHQQEHCRAGYTSVFVIILVLFVAPMVISTSINFIKATCGSKKQQPKRRDIVIFLIVLFTLSLALWNFLQQLGYIPVSSQIVFLLACINSSIKPFIYFLVGRSWSPCSVRSFRECLRRVFEEPEENTPSSNEAAMDSVI